VPEALEAVVMKAMARMTKDRFESAAEMLEALKACERDAPPGTEVPAASPVRVKRSSRAAREARVVSSADTAPVPGGAVNGAPRDIGARIAAGAQPVYLAVLPVEDATPEADAERTRVLSEMIDTAAASLSDLERVRVVTMPAEPGDLRARARAAGANLVLQSKARANGTALRVTFALMDPEAETRLGGGTVDGSVLEPFRLEDRFVEAVADALLRAGAAGSRRPRVSDPAARDRYAQALSYLERFDNEASLNESVRVFEGLLESEGDSAPLLASLSRAQLALYALTSRRGHEARATRSCERATAIDPRAPEVLLALAELLLTSGRPEEALAECDRLMVLRPGDFEGRLARVRALDALDRGAEAAAECRLAVSLRPDDWRGQHVLAERAFRCGRNEEAIAGWHRATELCPDNAGAWRNLGAACGQSDRLLEAIEAFRRSIAIRPSALAYHNLGAALFYTKRYEECREALELGVALNPLNAESWGNLGNACRFIPGQEARMKEALERAIALGREDLARDPRDGDMWGRLAGWLSNLEQHGQAVESVERALSVSPHDVLVMVRAAFVYFGAGDRASALHWIDEAVRHGRGVETFRSAPELASLEGDPEFTRILQRVATKQAP
jgi:tetratricopeptide (TPR) repeat protein